LFNFLLRSRRNEFIYNKKPFEYGRLEVESRIEEKGRKLPPSLSLSFSFFSFFFSLSFFSFSFSSLLFASLRFSSLLFASLRFSSLLFASLRFSSREATPDIQHWFATHDSSNPTKSKKLRNHHLIDYFSFEGWWQWSRSEAKQWRGEGQGLGIHTFRGYANWVDFTKFSLKKRPLAI